MKMSVLQLVGWLHVPPFSAVTCPTLPVQLVRDVLVLSVAPTVADILSVNDAILPVLPVVLAIAAVLAVLTVILHVLTVALTEPH